MQTAICPLQTPPQNPEWPPLFVSLTWLRFQPRVGPGGAACPTSAPPAAINSLTVHGNLGEVNGLAPVGPPDIPASLGVSFRLHEHPDVTSPLEVCAAWGVPLERTVKTLASVTLEDRLLLAALPGHARPRYGALPRAAGIRRGDLSPAGAGRPARAGMQPGGDAAGRGVSGVRGPDRGGVRRDGQQPGTGALRQRPARQQHRDRGGGAHGSRPGGRFGVHADPRPPGG